MKKLFTILFGMSLVAVCTTVSAKQNIYEWKNGEVNVRSIEALDSLTFSADGFYAPTCTDAKDVTKTSFSGTATVALAQGVKSVDGATPTIGICYSDKNAEPTTSNESRYLGKELKSYDFTLEGLKSGTMYYYRAYALLQGSVCYGEVHSVQMLEDKMVDNSCYINGHWFVDLELPSGLLWADTNIGATLPGDCGGYFSWGETSTKEAYTWDAYKYGSSKKNITKYNTADGKTTLEADDDAATANWGEACRMPTSLEYKELQNSAYCSWSWVSQTDSDGLPIDGWKVTSKRNGNSIFFPAVGGVYEEGETSYGQLGFYWTSSISEVETCSGYAFNFGAENHFFSSSYTRYYGFSVRPVAPQTDAE